MRNETSAERIARLGFVWTSVTLFAIGGGGLIAQIVGIAAGRSPAISLLSFAAATVCGILGRQGRSIVAVEVAEKKGRLVVEMDDRD